MVHSERVPLAFYRTLTTSHTTTLYNNLNSRRIPRLPNLQPIVSETESLLMRIRRRFKPAPEPEGPLLAPAKKTYRFLALAVAKARADNLMQQAASLAFITIVSLVPLLAALSFLGAQWFDKEQERTVELLSQILPYSEEKVLTTLQGFLEQALAIRGVGFAAFIVASLAVFTNIDVTINRIWNVSRQRPFRSRLLSFTLVLFWGPLVIGSTYSLLFYLRSRPAMNDLADSLPAQLIPFVVTLLGLTMLYWLVPYTSVRFSSAFAGGLTAALLLEGLRQGFGIYVDQVPNFTFVYGGFGLLLFFMLSIQLAWLIVLLGSEAAYSLQNAAYMSSRKRPAAPLEGSWVALAALILITDRFRDGKPISPHELLADRLQLETDDLAQILTPLMDAGILCDSSGDTDGYLLASDPHELEIAKVFELYEPSHWDILQPLSPTLADGLESLRTRLAAERSRQTEGVLLIQLAGRQTEPEGSEVAQSLHQEPSTGSEVVQASHRASTPGSENA